MKRRPAAQDPEPTPLEALGAGDNFRLGLLLFLIALAMFFGASIIGYLFIRLNSPMAPPPGHILLPGGLWVSTAALLAAGWAIHVADRRAQEDRIAALRGWLALTSGFGAGFIAIQWPCMLELLRIHRVALAQQGGAIYGLTFALVIIHGLHVLGGMVPLALLTFRAWRDTLGRNPQLAVHGCALYWHFLEVVWIALFGVFLITA